MPQVRHADRLSQVDAYRSHIDVWLHESPHITAKRIGVLLRERVDAEVVIGERALRRYVAGRRRILVPKEAFVRATYPPAAQAQFDFTPVSALIAGVLVTLQLFVMRLSYSGRLFARASCRCDQPALFAGILEALVTFVKRALRGRSRDENAAFRAFCGALAFPIEFAAPGNTPLPSFASIADLNAALADFCEANELREHSVHHETIGARFAREEIALRSLAQALPRPCVVRPVQINKFSEITLDSNRYSVPTQYAHRAAFVEIYDSRLRITIGNSVVAEHPRAPGRGQLYLDPVHFTSERAFC